jgi:2'-5' RNA ligase
VNPAEPLVLTLQLDTASAQHFNQLRQQYFPQALNFLSAHVTLFHHLPGHEKSEIAATLEQIRKDYRVINVRVGGLRFLGRGVAYRLESAPLSALRDRLAQQWRHWLTPQDLGHFQPHITVQNKVSPEEARRTLAVLDAAFTPHTIVGTGLDLWRYAGGPWEHLAEFLFLQLPEK